MSVAGALSASGSVAGAVAAVAALGALLLLALSGQAAGQPDLAVTVAPTQDLPAQSLVPVSVTLWNVGDVGSPVASVLIAVDGNPTDPPLSFDPIGAGSSQTLEAHFTLGCGSHTISAVADPAGDVNESDETNNAATAVARVVPVPSFELAVTDAADGHTLSLDATATTGCRPLAFAWAILPGGPAEGEVVDHPVDSGNVTVTLTVTSIDDPSIRASATRTTQVKNIPPWVSASIPDAPIPTGKPSGLAVNATDVDGDVVSYSIDMGDGYTAVSLAAAASHAYERAGTYTVVVTVTDNGGTRNETFYEHTVLNRPPVARVVPATAGVEAGAPVELSAVLSSDPEGTGLTYRWAFGDGSEPVPGVTVSHAFDAPGSYLVTVTATDADGGWSNGTAVVTVAPGAPASAFGPEVPLFLAAAFAVAVVASFAFSRRRTPRPSARRPPPPPRAGSTDPAPPGAGEDE